MSKAAEDLYYNTDDRLELARMLVTHLEKGDDEECSRIINSLYMQKEHTLFQEIGKLTRQLHDALGSCRNDQRISNLAAREMPDARQRLGYVMQKTEESAHRTLNAVETALPLSKKLKTDAASMTRDWQRFKRRELSAEDFRLLSKRLEKFLESVNTCTLEIDDCLSEILLAQDYQDITGQIISRVIGIVEEVEQGLVSVIRDCGETSQSPAETEPDIRAEGPQVNSKRADVVKGQDDVDDLLISLGF